MYLITHQHIVDNVTGEIITPKFDKYTCPEDYERDYILPVEPMTAKEYLNDEELDTMLNSTNYIAEEKLDGTRATLHIRAEGNRVFSRRISKKTDWYVENSDSVPHIRDLTVSEDLYGTVLDGEMRIDGQEFKEVSSTLNCTWDKAIRRQAELGYITLHVFDIIYYKGIYIAKMPLWKRKQYLKKVCDELNFKYIHEEEYTTDQKVITLDSKLLDAYRDGKLESYPNLMEVIDSTIYSKEDTSMMTRSVNKITWYEYIVATGGEGLMLKDINGTYKHTRGREYTKLKKFETWDVVVLDFVPPSRDYTGKEASNPKAKWEYWYDAECDSVIVHDTLTMKEAESRGLLPCTKHYAMDWIGTIKYGVLITPKELEAWKKTNPKEKPELIKRLPSNGCNFNDYLVVGECSGFDEETREYITANTENLRGTVIEIKANEVLKTGKLRHPRFTRFREDKEAEQCIWKDHMRF